MDKGFKWRTASYLAYEEKIVQLKKKMELAWPLCDKIHPMWNDEHLSWRTLKEPYKEEKTKEYMEEDSLQLSLFWWEVVGREVKALVVK